MTSPLVINGPKPENYQTFNEQNSSLDELEKSERTDRDWCWFCSFGKCPLCWCCSRETVADNDDDINKTLVNYVQEIQSTSHGGKRNKVIVSTKDLLKYKDTRDINVSPEEKKLLGPQHLSIDQNRLPEFQNTSINKFTNTKSKSELTILLSSCSDVDEKDEAGVTEAHSSPMLASPRNGTKSATPSPVTSTGKRNGARPGQLWHNDEDLDRIVGLQTRASLSTLGARSDSMASVYSGAGEGRYGTVAVRGQVEFGLQYNYKAGALEIQIKQCKDLAPVDAKRNRSDPYVKVYLLPDKSKSGKRKTKVKKHTLNPVFDECLKFHISLNGLESRTLWLTVWHSDMFGRNDFLGEVMMALENKVFDDPTPKWYNLQERTEPFEEVASYKGDIIVCLKFVPPDMTVQKKGKRSRGALHVLIKEAKSLTAVKANGTSDPFCKSYLLPDKGRSSKQKTPVARRTTNPVWNYTFVYDDVTLQELAERCLELTVWDHDRLASNEFLGGIRFSLGTGKHYGKPADWMDASGRELSLWKNMLEKPNFWVEGSLSLRPSLESRGS